MGKISCDITSEPKLQCGSVVGGSPTPSMDQSSLASLIVWNVSKAQEKNPYIDLRSALTSVAGRLESCSEDAARFPEDRHVACALLAWQQLGNDDVDGLCNFVNTALKQKQQEEKQQKTQPDPKMETSCTRARDESKHVFETKSRIGPVLRLPMETKIVMRLEQSGSARRGPGYARAPTAAPAAPRQEVMDKIQAACCMDSECSEALKSLEAGVETLSRRAKALARREAERVELLERAEAAWRDLELGYQRRLTLAEEKEDEIMQQIHSMIEERKGFKVVAQTLASTLAARAEDAERLQNTLAKVEKEVCDRACERLSLGEQCARGEAALAEQQCKAAQIDRDLQMKEEQARRRMATMEREVESARAMAVEAECALRAELGELSKQVSQVSEQLLDEDQINKTIKDELTELQNEKDAIIESLDGCKVMCDSRMQLKVDELKAKREQLAQLRDQVAECRCKLPVDAGVEVKRTPSLAALCYCDAADERLTESCSCTSVRDTLLTNFLASLFGGLQSEMSNVAASMPCELLKCFDDKHSWDKPNNVTTNLRNYFSKLLVGEMDIAIATSIEKYHARWVGTCVHSSRYEEEDGEDTERSVEQRAQTLAHQLAEQLFREKENQLVQKAKDIMQAGPPPCDCEPNDPAVYSCLVETPVIGVLKKGRPVTMTKTSCSSNSSPSPPPAQPPPPTPALYSPATVTPVLAALPYKSVADPVPESWRRTMQNVTQLRIQVQTLKKQIVKKQDLKLIEEKITNFVQHYKASDLLEPKTDKENAVTKDTVDKKKRRDDKASKQLQIISHNRINTNRNKIKKDGSVVPYSEKSPQKINKKLERSYAVNLCLCGTNDKEKIVKKVMSEKNKPTWKQKTSKDLVIAQVPSVKSSKPINQPLVLDEPNSNNQKQFFEKQLAIQSTSIEQEKQNELITETLTKQPQQPTSENLPKTSHLPCPSTGVCFHKHPSNSSLDELLNKLSKWKSTVTEEEFVQTSLIVEKYLEESRNDVREPKNIDMPIECVQKSIIKKHSSQLNLPITTESEYMGQLDLDKSHEICCECIKNEINIIGDSNVPVLKCVNNESCDCKEKTTRQKQGVSLQNTEVQVEDIKVINKDGINQLDPASQILEQISQGEGLRGDYSYNVKFLGVTLAGIKQPNLNQESKANDRQIKIEKKNATTKRIINSENETTLSKPVNYIDNSCLCDKKFDLFKDYVANVLQKPKKETWMLKDKALDTQSFMETTQKKEHCVCCQDNNDADTSKDLEVNVFHLLREHLKGKLSSCTNDSNVPCFTPEVEEKLFSNILQKIKKVISDSTNTIKCKCLTDTAEGSWNRAYTLLQEYLKTKLQRLQCSCVTVEDGKEKVLPDVINKVCNLIDNDFERLSEICRRKKTVNDKIIEEFDVPMTEHDVHQIVCTKTEAESNNERNGNINAEPLMRQLSQSVIINKNTSGQFSWHVGMDTKSCDPKEVETKDVDTIVLLDKELTSRGCSCCNTSIFPSCLAVGGEKTETPEVKYDMFRITGSLPNRNVDLMNVTKNFDHISPIDLIDTKLLCQECKTPFRYEYVHRKEVPQTNSAVQNTRNINTRDKSINDTNAIGMRYALNCSYDGLLSACICSKSLAGSNAEKVSYVWDSRIRQERQDSKAFTVSNINKQSEGKEENHTVRTVQRIPENNKSEAGVEAEDGDDIVLIDSVCKRDVGSKVNEGSVTTAQMDNFTSANPLTFYRSLHQRNILNELKSPNVLAQNNTHKVYSIKNDDTDSSKSSEISPNCDCNVVPICHVKMLIQNIEDKLAQSECTCDSLCSEVCPVHAQY